MPTSTSLSVNNQKGLTPILLLLVALGILVFLFITNTFSFKDNLFNKLFPKPASHAAEDILEELHITGSKSREGRKGRNFNGATEEEKKIIQMIENEPMEFDEIVRISAMEASKLGSLLSIMEIKGMVKNVGNNRYTCT